MKDIRMTSDGDLYIDENDVAITNSVVQAINIRLRWFLNEWMFSPDKGVDWFGEIFVKNPNEDKIANMISDAILSVDEVLSVEDVEIEIDTQTRRATITYEAVLEEETLKEEVELWIMA